MNILEEADQIIHGDRNNDYGSPLQNHSLTAEYFNVYLSHRKGPLNAEDVCWLNVLQKVSRQQYKHKRDNLVDVVGYVGNIEMINEELEKK